MSHGYSQGLHVAKVIDVEDPLKLNRIKTKIPGINGGGLELNYSPLLTASAGSGYGIVLPPKEGDYVIVAFLNANIETPVILGSIYTKTNTPPLKPKKNNNTVRAYTTAAGMEVYLYDGENNSGINIKTSQNHKLELKDTKENGLVNIKSSDGRTQVSIDLKESNIKIEAKNINLKATNQACISAGGSSVTVSNSSGINIKTDKTLGLKAKSIKANADAAMNVGAT
ncbi:MAG: hypothetical protein IKE05_01805 [Clostridia bacterium]|nr:hypothetical protein [Clostridia bacterium]